MTNSSKGSVCAPRAKEERYTMCVMASDETGLPSATVRSRECCNGIDSNPCNCANEKSINDAVAPQSAMAMVLNKVSLLAMLHGKTI